MSTIEANVSIDIPDGTDSEDIIEQIKHIVSSINGKDTHINIIEVDNPLSLSPVTIKKIKE